MNEIIRKRKSIRKYSPTPLDDATMQQIQEKINTLTPLYPHIRHSVEFTAKTKGMFHVKAPHYLIFGSEEKEGSYENIGFLGQQLDLFLSELGIGTCWLGAAKPEEKQASALPYVVAMSFGTPDEPIHRTHATFKRKPLDQISEGSDSRLEAARLAPSGMNAQNWHFIAEDGKIHCYRKKPKAPLGFILNKLGSIDIGIAICHIAAETENFHFIADENAPERKGYIYTGTVGK